MYKYKKGDIVTGKVTGIKSYGIFLSFKDGSSGLLHISEITNGYVKNIYEYVNLNDSVKVRIVDCLNDDHYRLSTRNLALGKKYSKPKIRETRNGFSTLKSLLPRWINDKILAIDEKNNGF